ncbi:MAG: Gfo/Idh/MocA family oxidoreductase [Myxococcota bacterium]
MSAVRVLVIGCGYMGRHHAEKVAALSRDESAVTLAGVADPDLEAARGVAEQLGTRFAANAEELFSVADAAIVAIPTVDHHSVVSAALSANLDVLVEKPIAATVDEGKRLLSLARQLGRVLQVGHQEWFNPALRVIRERIHKPRFVEAHRLSRFPDRATDIDVVRDLMIHDLDILQQLIGSPPERIEAIGIPVVTQQVDIANARVVFPSGCIANLTASRVSVNPMRKIRFFQRDGYFSIDFLSQSVSIFRRLEGNGDDVSRVEIEELKIDPDDALAAQLCAFLDAIRTRSTSGGDGLDALGALGTAMRVIDSMPALGDLQ